MGKLCTPAPLRKARARAVVNAAPLNAGDALDAMTAYDRLTSEPTLTRWRARARRADRRTLADFLTRIHHELMARDTAGDV